MNIEDRLGVCSWSLLPDDGAALVEQVRRLGLPKLQLALDPIREDPGRWAGLEDRLTDAGIQLVSGQFGAVGEDYSSPQTIRATGGVVPEATWPANRENLEASLGLAERFGLTVLTTHAGFIPPDPGDTVFGRLVERVRHLADRITDRLDGRLLLETGQETAETLERFLTAIDRDRVGVNFDPANLLLYDMGDPVTALRRLLPRLGQFHVKDATPPTEPGHWGAELPVGEGAVDWAGVLSALSEAGYVGDLIIEREAGQQRAQDIAVARDRIKAAWPGD